MLDLFDQDTSSYVVFAYPQKNVSEGRARARIFDNAIDLACLMQQFCSEIKVGEVPDSPIQTVW